MINENFLNSLYILAALFIMVVICSNCIGQPINGEFKSGYCAFTIRIPRFISLFLFFTVKKHRFHICYVFVQIVLCLVAVLQVVLCVGGVYVLSDLFIKYLEWIIYCYLFVLLLPVLDAFLHTDKDDQPRDTKLSKRWKM